MDLTPPILLFAVGLVLIVKGGDWFVDSAAWLAEVTGIPKFIVGATIVSVATTLPEMIVSVMASLDGMTDMAVGNAVGSVIANTGLILAISLIFLPAAISRKQFSFKGCLLIASCVALLIFALSGQVTVYAGLVLGLIFLIYIADNLHQGKSETEIDQRLPFEKKELPRRVLFFLAGAGGIVLGSRLLVDNGSTLARLMGVPENIIGLTIVAVGTSLPELVTAIASITKKQGALSVGNIIGANIIDLALILPVCAIVSGGSLPINAQTFTVDLPVCLLLTCLAMVPTMLKGKFRRWQGFALLGSYAAYLVFIIMVL
ncbi:MAG: calcium/sodium antiporter [Oscillospiraceae bacterium]